MSIDKDSYVYNANELLYLLLCL